MEQKEQHNQRQTLILLQKHLQVQKGEPLAQSSAVEVNQLRELLTAQISWLLDHDFERLVQAMYRIDVAEQDFKAVLSGATSVASSLAELVLEREQKKVEMRQKFSSNLASVKPQ